MPLNYLRLAGWAFCHGFNEDYQKRSANRYDQARYLCGMNGKLECGDGQTGNPGVLAGSPVAF